MFNDSDLRALVAPSTSGLKLACLSASRHNIHGFSNGHACLGKDATLMMIIHSAEASRLPWPGLCVGCDAVDVHQVPLETPNPVLIEWFAASNAIATIMRAD
jgi:hypothetical protein